MGTTFKLDDIPLDAGFSFDDSLYFDSSFLTDIDFQATISVDEQYIIQEFLELTIRFEWDLTDVAARYVDLLQLVPEKFRDSVLLQDYLKAVGIYVGSWLGKIDDIAVLYDRDTVPRDYAQYLADLIHLDLAQDDDTTVAEMRQQIRQAVDAYKLKGTYECMDIIAYALKLSISIVDYYTNDYSTFERVEDWFIGDEGENPPGLDVTYYKSPHFGLEINLIKKYSINEEDYLWKSRLMTQLSQYVEKNRPVNTVPHYILVLTPITDENGDTTVTSADISTRVTDDWQTSRLYFDLGAGGSSIVSSSGTNFHFDDGDYFDWTREAFIGLVTHWKVGTGNKGVSPDTSGFDMETVTDTGTVDEYTLYDDRVEFVFTIPKATVRAGISELGLYLNDTTTLVVASTFPDIDKNSDAELRVKIIVYDII